MEFRNSLSDDVAPLISLFCKREISGATSLGEQTKDLPPNGPFGPSPYG